MNALWIATLALRASACVRKRLQWRLLAIVDRPFTDDHYPPTSKEIDQRLRTLEPGEYLQVAVIVKALNWLDAPKGCKQ